MQNQNEQIIENQVSEETVAAKAKPANSTYGIISKVAYLAGVPKHIFENPFEPPQMECFEEMQADKNARIIRNLCRLRTAIELNFSYVHSGMHYYLKNLQDFPEQIPQDCLEQLRADGIEILKSNHKLTEYVIDINNHIVNRISNCKTMFPLWLNWDYVKAVFIMPNGRTVEGIRAAASKYYANKKDYPYQVYINWRGSAGNILYNDEKFVTLLYAANGDRFEDTSKVTDASASSKDTVYDFLDRSERVAVMVDCENVDPMRLYATLNNLDENALLDKICKIVLLDDIHTASVWRVFHQYTKIPVEYKQIERVIARKSIVDHALVANASREHFKNNMDSIVIFASDSDYWGLYSEIPEARYLVMAEHGKLGRDTKVALQKAGIPYCYTDEFCTGNCEKFKVGAVLNEVQKQLDQALDLNIHEVMEKAYCATWVKMTNAEREQFYHRYIKGMRLTIAEDGKLAIAVAS